MKEKIIMVIIVLTVAGILANMTVKKGINIYKDYNKRLSQYLTIKEGMIK